MVERLRSSPCQSRNFNTSTTSVERPLPLPMVEILNKPLVISRETPKPNKPGKMRPITQPHKEDFIVMDALSQLLNIVFEDIFLTQSHGFRKGRGPITFFAHVQSWGEVDRLIKADIVGCFDNIEHALLNSRVRLNIGNHNEN
ncbi:hypothetical protein Sjap_026632 [Stephania japonica]|uniref:Reverse transcriptase domain-containing protein n=1 Tax=Stephania japonica TaxID=461633 RepID=A0AAP0DXV2_9MAGN